MPNSAYLTQSRDKGRIQYVYMFVKSKIESSVIPRSLTEGTGARIWPRKELWHPNFCCCVPNKMSLVLLGLMNSLLVERQAAMVRRSSETLIRQEPMSLNENERYHRHMNLPLKIWQQRVSHGWTPEVRHVWRLVPQSEMCLVVLGAYGW